MILRRRLHLYYSCIGCLLGLSATLWILNNVHFHQKIRTRSPDYRNLNTEQLTAWTPKYEVDPLKHDSHIQLNKFYSKRRKTMLEACAGRESDPAFRGNSSEKSIKSHFVVDRKHRILYCAIEKIGSTFWRRLWQILAGLSSVHSPYDIQPVDALGGGQETFTNLLFDEIHTIISTYRSFIITRHPFSRLFAGYVDKLFSPNPVFWKGLGAYIVSNFREGKQRQQDISCGSDVTFQEFVKYIIHSETHNSNRNGHFLPMHDHCRPCQVKYDIIGQMETFVDDTLYIVKSLGFDDLANTLNKTMQMSYVTDTIEDQVDILFRYEKQLHLCTRFYNAQKTMWRKFQIRGIISKHSKFPFTEKQAGNITQHDYIVAVTNAVREASYKEQAEQNRQEAYAEAFKSVDRDDMTRLVRILHADCEVFGYDCSLISLYDKINTFHSDVRYFDIKSA